MKQIETMSELMAAVQRDMEAVRNGEMDLIKGRLIKDYHKLLLEGAQLTLQQQRLQRGQRPEKELRIIKALPEEGVA